MRIIGPPSASHITVIENIQPIRNVHARFINDMIPHLWAAATRYRVDPVGVVAQAAKETGWGTFEGKVEPEFHNSCGLKLTEEQRALFPGVTDKDNPLTHAMFPTWQQGAIAHVQHLRAYSGWLVEDEDIIIDPRYYIVANSGKLWCENFEDLSGRWAPGPDYGAKIVEIARKLQA